MKKFLILLLSAVLALSCAAGLAACNILPPDDETGGPVQPVDPDKPHEHNFGEWVVTIPATCTAMGEEQRTCACGETETRPIEAKGHTEAIDAAVAPTCTETGLTEGKHCSVCKKVLVEQEVVPALDHDWDEGKVTTPATCTQEGKMAYICTRCGDTKTEPTAKLPHTPGASVRENEKPATCEDAGSYELVIYCSVCKAEISRETEAISPFGHKISASWSWDEEVHYKTCANDPSERLEVAEHNFVNNQCTVCGRFETLEPTEDLKYELSADRTYFIVSGIESASTKYIVIPTELNGLPIKAIGNSAFKNSNIGSIYIPDGVTSIGSSAFEWCDSLTSITIPDSVTSIGRYAFYACSGLTSVHITDIEAWCAIDFEDGSANPLSYAQNLYLNGELVTDLVIPDGTASIGSSAFSGCSSLTSIIIPDSVTSIEDSVFSGCSSLTNIIIPDNVTSIGYGAFMGCESLTRITIPDSVTSIGSSAFSSCSSLTNIIIPDSVTSIGSSAFSGCSSLTNIIIPDSVTSIGHQAFQYCFSLTSITIPDSVTSIGRSAFEGCSSLTSITIPNSVTSIGDYAFSHCINIESATMPTLAIDFIPQDNLKTVVLTSGTSIGDKAFRSCSRLTSITIPDSVTFIGHDAFRGCSNLKYNEYNYGLYLGNDTNPYAALIKAKNPYLISCEIFADTKVIAGGAFEDCALLTEIVIPDGTTFIGSYTFYGCSSLTSITIPGSVTSIGSWSFAYCSGLTSITIPDSVTSIGERAFDSCRGLASITIGGGVTSIGGAAFYGCESLTSITIPDSVTSIGDGAFNSCDRLTSIIIPDSVTSIGDRAFQGCSSLTSITIPDSVKLIGSHAFYNCDNLTSVTFENPNRWSRNDHTLSEEDLSDPATAARYLCRSYYDYTWTRR